jgi:phosphoglycolate phosphatase-like HAD superfamily hydrolase
MRNTPVVNAVIVDMDNTLYDWVGYFVPAIQAMLAKAAQLLGVENDALRDDLRAVHVAHRNTEYPFALLETRTVVARFPGLTTPERHDALEPAFAAFNRVREQHLHLYPGVAESMKKIKDAGCNLYGHTEATDINITSRSRALGLQGQLEAIYAPRFNGSPHPLGVRRQGLANSVPVRSLPPTARKPDPEAMRLILSEIGVPPHRCLYVGDNLLKDISMAKRAGMLAAWARYGTEHDSSLWRALVSISHWDSAAAANDRPPEAIDVQPDVVLKSFGELFEHFIFAAS